ncbi:hypothetical protein WICPIJ_007436 [Wickerhamomyces pijperi]|uniref:Uncharacterized protein n=1 Tax=Wickerhamomyces pijperi TaxID=599730 RepID=A0A9P8Q0G6_WICPI|nr:hypothetical protein WICPIJ_007436 [Wickerhamomyces pijperi]
MEWSFGWFVAVACFGLVVLDVAVTGATVLVLGLAVADLDFFPPLEPLFLFFTATTDEELPFSSSFTKSCDSSDTSETSTVPPSSSDSPSSEIFESTTSTS